MKILPFLLFLCTALSLNTTIYAQPVLAFNALQGGFSSPVDIANAGDGTDRIFIVEQAGVIKIMQGSSVLPTPFLDINGQVGCCGERGLLGLAFHPAYSSNGYFYVNYTDNNGDTQISRFSVDPSDANQALPASELSILKIDQPFSNHNAGDLNFGPLDGYLYIAMGDGGSGGDPGNRSQDPLCLLGKVLRIDVNAVVGDIGSDSQTGACGFDNQKNYTIPPSNPFIGVAGVLPEIWSIGWRNPWRFSFDPMNGDMWVADVGQGLWEEVDRELSASGGGNYGWRCYEGNHAYNTSGCGPMSSYIPAVFEYPHNSSGGFSITGGYVYRGSQYPNMQGHYVVTDYVTGNTWTLSVNTSGAVVAEVQSGISNISSFGVRENGELLAITLGGQLFTVDDLSVLPIELIDFNGKYNNGVNQLNWSTASEINADRFEVEKSVDGNRFEKIGELSAGASSSNIEKQYSYSDATRHAEKNYYRLKMIDRDGTYSYSSIIIIKVDLPFGIDLFPNPTNGNVELSILGEVNATGKLIVFDISGKPVFENILEKGIEKMTLDLSTLSPNVYFLRLVTEKHIIVEKVIVE